MRRYVFFPALAAAFAVFAVAAGAAWLASGNGSTFTRSTSLGKPTAVAAASTGTTSIQVTWNAPAAPSPSPTSYDVFRYFGGSGTKICSAVPAASPRVCNDAGLSPSTTYGYTVEARLGSNWLSGQTTQVNATTDAPAATPNFLVELVAAGNKTAGTAFQVRVTARNNTTTDATYTGNKNLTFSGPGQNTGFAAPTYPTNPVSFSSGVATVNVTLRKAETVPLAVSEGTRTGSTSVTVVTGAASILRYTSSTHNSVAAPCAPGGTVSVGRAETWQTKVSRFDADGNPVTTGTTTITVSLSGKGTLSPPASPYNIVGPASETATAFSFTVEDKNNPGSGTITAASSGLTSAVCTVGP